MACWIVVPVKAPDACKTRLAGALSDEARQALVARMLRHVVMTARSVAGAETYVLGPSRHGLSEDVPLLADFGHDLNAALAGALAVAEAAKVERLVVLPADLPGITRDDVAALIDAGGAMIAPDRRHDGTNALSLPLPAAGGFRFGYGVGSFARHRERLATLGLAVAVHDAPGLAFDVDQPADLVHLGTDSDIGDSDGQA